MDSPSRTRSRVRIDDEEQEGIDKRKHRSSKSKKLSNVEEVEGLDSSGRRRSYGDRNETQKRSGCSSGAGSDEDDYNTRKELRSKQLKKKQEESALEKLSSWYQDGELENKQDGGDKLGRHGRADESERRKMTSKFSEHESSQSRTKSKEERSHDKEFEKTTDRESRYLDRKEMNQEKGHGSSDQVKNSRRRWDESYTVRKAEESLYEKTDMISGKASDLNHESVAERSLSAKNELLGSNSDKSIRSNTREERRVDADRSKSKGKADALEEERRKSPSTREGRSGKEKSEKHRHQRTPADQDAAESRERVSNTDEDGGAWSRDKSIREVEHSSQSKTLEKSGRHHQESDLSEMNYEKSMDLRRKELPKDVHKDDSGNDRSRDRESSKENWKKRQPSNNDKDSKDVDTVHDRGRDWDLSRHGSERTDNERPRGRSGNRKDGIRGEAVKTSSKFGISNENYDVIEIQTKPLDYGKAESGSNFSSRTEVAQQSDIKTASNDDEWNLREDRGQRTDIQGSGPSGNDSWRDDSDFQGTKERGHKGDMSSRSAVGQSSSTGSQPYGNQEGGSYNRAAPQQGVKGGRLGRGGRGRPAGRDNQQVGLPLPIMGSPFGPLGRPPSGPMQPLTPGMSPAPGLQISPGVFIPPFSPVWSGVRGVDMSNLAVPPSLSPVPPGPLNTKFPPHMGTPSNQAMYFNQTGPVRGVPPGITGTGFNAVGPIGRGTPPDKNSGGWLPPRSSGPPGKAPSRGEQNDYSQNFVDTGMRPQNFIRELELTNIVEDYPKLRELIQKKDEIVANSASAPMYYKCDMREFDLSPEFFGTKFDVILVDPPWEEYVHRAPGVADHMEYWTFEEILNLKIEAIADTPSFIFLWVGDGVGLEQGRQCLKKWGFRRCEDICWVKTNKTNATPGLRHDSHTLFQHSKEHCLMGIKGTVRRSTDGHIIHANIDTDVIIAEEPSYGSTQKPEDMYRIVEHFSLGRRRLELFGEDHNIRAGWVTVGNGLSSSNYNAEAYLRNFADKDGKVWQGGGGRNPPPEAPHLVVTTLDIEALRPKSPMKNQQQLQQQSSSISLTGNSSNRRTAGNSPQNPNALSMNQESANSNPSNSALWASPMESFKGREHGNIPSEDNMYGYSGYATVNYKDFDSHIALNFL